MKALVLHVREYDFTDDDGKRVQGVKVTYLQDELEDTPGSKGVPVLQVTGGREIFAALGDVPGVYDLDWRQRAGRYNRPTLQLAGMAYVGKASLKLADVAT